MSIRTHDRESGVPGGGKGRKDRVGGSGVYPMSGPHPPGNAPAVWPGGWGQGKRGAAGYQDHGESELNLAQVIPEKVRDLMTKDPAFCQASDTAALAARIMKEHNIGALPVVANLHTRMLTGIVTDRDLAVRVMAAGLDPHASAVHEIMSSPVITCSPDADYPEVVRLMERHQIKRVLAVDQSGCVVGIVSQADIALRLPEAAVIADVVRSIAQPR